MTKPPYSIRDQQDRCPDCGAWPTVAEVDYHDGDCPQCGYSFEGRFTQRHAEGREQ
jgi:ribosomal protein L37AE/L43A